MQPDVFRTLCEVDSGKCRTTGNLARFLIAKPESKIGKRPYKEPSEMSAVKKFNNTIYKILGMMPEFEDAEDAEITPVFFKLEKEAQQIWIDFYNWCEKEQIEAGDLEEIRDFASKSAEQAARIACIFHIFEHQNLSIHISGDTMQRAVRLARWYLDEARRVLINMAVPEVHNNALQLWHWLHVRCLQEDNYCYTGNDILQYGPNPVRKKDKRDAALQLLHTYGYIKLENRGRSVFIYLNPLIC
jgi:putative DNA primase/helicase